MNFYRTKLTCTHSASLFQHRVLPFPPRGSRTPLLRESTPVEGGGPACRGIASPGERWAGAGPRGHPSAQHWASAFLKDTLQKYIVTEYNNLLPSRKGLTGAVCCSLLPHSKYFYLIWMKCIIFLMKGFFFKGLFSLVQQLPLLGSTHAVLGRGFFSLKSRQTLCPQKPTLGARKASGPGFST